MRVWPLFCVGAAIILAVLGWLSFATLDARHDERLRNALRRVDHRLQLILAYERTRPHTDYVSYPYLEGAVYSRSFKKLQKDQVKIPSPLLKYKPPHVLLHFQVDEEGVFSSPQVPTGTSGEIAAEQQQVAELAVAEGRAQLQSIAEVIGADALRHTVGSGFWGVWRGGRLLFVRCIEVDERRLVQGFEVDWPGLRAVLLNEIWDLFPTATLEPGTDPDRQLFAMPAVLSAPRSWTRWHTTITVNWCTGLAVLALFALLLKRLLSHAEQQRRFASHVTHELRGPLTTFRLYHELLDEGMVDDEKQAEYFTTLRGESDRMAHMVENVIALSRLESGRAKLQRKRVTLAELMEHAGPALKQVAPELQTEVEESDAAAEADAEAVTQILVNLVENATKYGKPPIELAARRDDGHLRLAVRDQGSGPDGDAFRPYERGKHTGTATRGLGLGLSLSRRLAREMGGDLTLEPPACFVVRLPLADSRA